MFTLLLIVGVLVMIIGGADSTLFLFKIIYKSKLNIFIKMLLIFLLLVFAPIAFIFYMFIAASIKKRCYNFLLDLAYDNSVSYLEWTKIYDSEAWKLDTKYKMEIQNRAYQIKSFEGGLYA